MVQPQLWQSLPFSDQNAFVDFLGAHALWHAQLDAHIRRSLGASPFPTLPLGDGPVTGSEADWHLAHQMVHDGEASGLGLVGSPDFTAYDLNKPDEFKSWTWLHGQECVRLFVAAGL